MLLDTGLYLVRNGTALTKSSVFMTLCEEVLSELDSLYWYIDGATSPFISLFYEDREDDIDPFVLSGPEALYRPGVLSAFGDKIIANDWAEFVGYSTENDTQALKLSEGLTSRAQIRAMAQVAFYNIDGMFWECFAANESLIKGLIDSPYFDSRSHYLSESLSFAR